MTVGMLSAFVLGLVNSFKRVVSPALVIAFCALEGVALGALSKFFDSMIAPGENLVVQAVVGTFAAFDVNFGLATVAVLSYRAFSFWLPTIPGAIAYVQLRGTVKRWRATDAQARDDAQVAPA